MKQLQRALSLIALLIPILTQANHSDCNSYTMNVGPTFNFARYKIGNLNKTEGYLAGIHADIAHTHESNFCSKLRFDGRWNAGYIAGQDDRKLKINDYRPELDLGYNIMLGDCESIKFTPFTGVGFYYLSTKFRSEDVTHKFYNVYVPVGAKILWKVDEDCFDIGLAAEYRIDAWTRLKQVLPNVANTPKLKLKRTQGVSVEMPLTWHHESCCDLNWHTKVVPFFDWNRFGQTTAVNENNIRIATPRVQQWYLGLHVDVGLHF